MDRYFPVARVVRLTRAKRELDTAIHKVAGDNHLSIVDVLALLHEAGRPWIAAAEGEEAERRKNGDVP